MKVVVTRENFKRVLGLVSHTVGATSTLPILSNILIQTDKGRLKISATNLELGLIVWLGGQVEEEGSVTLPAKIVNDYVNTTLGEQITLETKDEKLQVITESSSATVKTLPSDEFPLIPQINSNGKIKLKTGELKKALTEVVFATASLETRPELAGVYIYIEEAYLYLVATDGYRLVERRLKIDSGATEGDFKPLVIPVKTVQECIRVLSSNSEDVEVELKQGENQILCKLPDIELVSRVIDSQFPDYKQLIPSEFKSKALLPRYDLAQAVKSASLFASSTKSVKVSFKTNTNLLEVYAASGDVGDSVVEVEGDLSGEEQQSVFNHKYLIDYLNSIGDDKVLLKANNETSPTIITPDGREDNLYLVMPIKA